MLESVIKPGGEIKVFWDDTPENFTQEKRNRVREYFAKKYHTDKVNVIFRPKGRTGKDEVDIAVTDNITDENYQRQLFKEWLGKTGVEVDFDDIIHLDKRVNDRLKQDKELSNRYKRWKLKRVEFDNFLSYGDGNVVDFTNFFGLTTVTSEPENQSGKTTMFRDLLLFLFFGKIEKGDKMLDVFNIYRQTNTVSVRGYVTIDNHDYLIERSLSRSLKRDKSDYNVKSELIFSRLLTDGTSENLSEEQRRETEELISRSIGDIGDFLLTIIATGDNLESLIDSKPTERGNVLNRFLGLEILSYKEEITKEIYNEWKANIKSNIYNIVQLEFDIKTYNDVIAEQEGVIHQNEEHLSQAREKHADLEKRKEAALSRRSNDVDQSLIIIREEDLLYEIDVRDKAYRHKQQDLDRINEGLSTPVLPFSPEEFSSVERDLTDRQTKVYAVAQEMAHTKQTGETLNEELKSAPDVISGLEGKRAKERELEALRDSLGAEKQPVDTQALTSEERTLFECTTQLNSEIANFENSIQNLLAGETCQSCKQPLKGVDNTARIANIKNEIGARKAALKKAADRSEILRAEIASNEELIAKARAHQNTVSQLTNLRQLISFDELRLKGMTEKKNRVLELRNKWINLRDEHTALETELAAIKEKHATLAGIRADNVARERDELFRDRLELEVRAKKNEVDAQRDKLTRWRDNRRRIEYNQQVDKEVFDLNYDITRLASGIRDAESAVALANYRIEEERKRITAHEKLITHIRNEEKIIKVFKVYQDLVGKNGISKIIMRNILPHLNSELERMLCDVVDFGVELEINDKNEIKFMMYDRNTPLRKDIKTGSGYERTVTSIALRCVLSRISCLPKPNIIVFDEVLGKVGNQNLPYMAKVFQMVSGMFDNVFLISHNTTVKDWGQHVITVCKKNNISVLT